MKTIVLDGIYMSSHEALHQYLADRFEAPEYYGKNLDALYDILTDIHEPTTIVLYRKSMALCSLGSYGQALMDTFRDAVHNNSFLIFLEDTPMSY